MRDFVKPLFFVLSITLALTFILVGLFGAPGLPVASAMSGLPEKLQDYEDRYQHDIDIARLNDLKVMGAYVEEYRNVKGRYPFEGEYDVPVYVYIATRGQQKYVKGAPPVEHVRVGVKDFIAELEEGLGTSVLLPFDPQKVPVKKPNFYIYMIDSGTFNLAVHLYSEFSFARKVSEHYFKVEVSNSPNTSYGIWPYEDLLKDKDFIAASSEKPAKPDYVEEMRQKMYSQEGGVF